MTPGARLHRKKFETRVRLQHFGGGYVLRRNPAGGDQRGLKLGRILAVWGAWTLPRQLPP